MTANLSALLRHGPFRIGQVHVSPGSDASVELRHVADAAEPAGTLEVFDEASAARRIALHTAEGHYRALKGAPDLRRGWRLVLEDRQDLEEALEAFYPAALALWTARNEDRLRVVPLADTLGRQTGMYRFARTISEPGATALTDRQCRQGCLRHPLWAGEPESCGGAGEPELPLWCPEACSLFVAEARLVAKGEFDAKAAAAAGADGA